jgi:hypothetical protein
MLALALWPAAQALLAYRDAEAALRRELDVSRPRAAGAGGEDRDDDQPAWWRRRRSGATRRRRGRERRARRSPAGGRGNAGPRSAPIVPVSLGVAIAASSWWVAPRWTGQPHLPRSPRGGQYGTHRRERPGHQNRGCSPGWRRGGGAPCGRTTDGEVTRVDPATFNSGHDRGRRRPNHPGGVRFHLGSQQRRPGVSRIHASTGDSCRSSPSERLPTASPPTTDRCRSRTGSTAPCPGSILGRHRAPSRSVGRSARDRRRGLSGSRTTGRRVARGPDTGASPAASTSATDRHDRTDSDPSGSSTRTTAPPPHRSVGAVKRVIDLQGPGLAVRGAVWVPVASPRMVGSIQGRRGPGTSSRAPSSGSRRSLVTIRARADGAPRRDSESRQQSLGSRHADPAEDFDVTSA